MLQTPANFVPLLEAVDHPAPLHFVFRGGELLVQAQDLSLPDSVTLTAFTISFQPIGLLDGRYAQAAWLPQDAEPPAGFEFRRLRSLFSQIDDQLLAVAGRAYQLSEWARTHRFCGACGNPTTLVSGERCVRCPACGHLAYPRISPAMMVLVKDGERILLARHKQNASQFFTALAGFVESGESIEDTVHREVFEEVGLKVRNLQYFGSQPWPFPHSLMVAYTADYAGGEIRLDENEIAEAAWFGPGDVLPPMPPLGLSIAGHLIHANLPKK